MADRAAVVAAVEEGAIREEAHRVGEHPRVGAAAGIIEGRKRDSSR